MASIQKRVDPSGRKRYIARIHHRGYERSKSFDRHAEAQDWIDKFAPRRSQKWSTSLDRVPLGTYVKAFAETADRPATRAGRKHLYDNLGPLHYRRMGDLDREDIKAWLDTLQTGREWADGAPLKKSTSLTLLGILSSALNTAIGDGALMTNPCSNLRLRRGNSKAVDPTNLIGPDAIRTLANGAGETLSAMIRTAATSGLRPGEIGGLRVKSVNLYRRELYVREQSAGGKTWAWSELKTDNAERTVPLPDATLEVIKREIEKHDDCPDAPLFRTRFGHQWSVANMDKSLRERRAEVDIADVSWKSFRHFYASHLIDTGASVAVVQKRLGHATPLVTLQVYTHLFPHEDERTRDAFSDLF